MAEFDVDTISIGSALSLSTIAPSKAALTITSDGGLAIASSSSDTNHSVPLDDALDSWTIAMGVHPALNDMVVNGLLRDANSEDEGQRFRAACHELLPKAKRILMQNDPSERIREVVTRILAYEEENK